MCRSIKTLRRADVVATDDEIREAARQFVRKVSGFTKPSSRHEAAFEEAIDEITVASQRLLGSIAGNLAGAGHHSYQAGVDRAGYAGPGRPAGEGTGTEGREPARGLP